VNIAEAVETLTGPGAPFEIVVEDVGGVPTKVYKSRLRSMRDLMAMTDPRGEIDFVVQGERRVTFADHNAAARRMANALVGRGLDRGDRVALLSANNADWVVTFWACAAANAVCVPLNAWWKADELAFALEDCGAKVLVCDQRRHDLVADVVKGLPALEQVYVIGSSEFAELTAGDDERVPDVDVDEDDITGIFYTSGTTGRSKGATLTHRQVIANLQNQFVLGTAAGLASGAAPAELSGTGQAAALLIVPLFHTTGCHSTMVLNYAAGAKLVLMPPGRFEPELAMRIIQDEKVTSIGGVPTIMWRIIESPRLAEFDLSSVTRIGYGGAPAAPELVQRIAEVFPNAKSGLSTAYGLTETASVATANIADDYFTHPSSAGRAAPTVELRIVDEAGNDVPTGEAGETIYCVEIEIVLFEHPDVIDAAVVGVPYKTLGEEVKAVVQRKPGSKLTSADLQAFCRERLADFKVPEYVEFVDQPLPRNPAGKVLKAALRGEGTAFTADATSDSAL